MSIDERRKENQLTYHSKARVTISSILPPRMGSLKGYCILF